VIKKFLLSVAVMAIYMVASAQTDSVSTEKKKIKVTGNPIVHIFANFHAETNNNKNDIGFALDRAYLGYQFSFYKNLSAKVVFDVGTPKLTGSDLERIAYAKNAMLTWTPNKFTLHIGLIGLEQFAAQEKVWGYRYIMKSFQDEYKFGNSADMGILGKYRFAKWGSLDVTFVNGEGFKKLQIDNRFRYGLGLTFHPIESITIRMYGDRYDKPEKDTLGQAQYVTAFFVGYKQGRFSLGGEWNMMINNAFKYDRQLMGFSVYGAVKLPKNFDIFARWDYLISNKKWNVANDGYAAIAGFQYSPIKHVSFSPNARIKMNQDGELSYFGIYLSLQVVL
jgi:hypothetical protein